MSRHAVPFLLVIAFCLWPSLSRAASIGQCRITKEKYAKHLFLVLSSGKKLLSDAKSYAATKGLLAEERSLLRIEKKDHAFSRNRLLGCKESSKRIRAMVVKAEITIVEIKKEYTRVVKLHREATRAVTNWKSKARKYRRQRWTWSLRIGGTLMIVAGVAMIGIEAHESVKKRSDPSPTMVTAGVGSLLVGAGSVSLSFALN